MYQLPVEILEIISDKILWENPGDLYRLRAISRTWKSVAEQSGSKVFNYWYNRCKTEIPEDHLQDIVQVKYPLVAQPWQEFYWVDSRLPHVAKNVYNIWKSLPNLNDDVDRSKCNYNYPLAGHEGDFAVCIHDQYFGVSGHNKETRIYRWNNLSEYIRLYDVESYQIDFYTTKKGTFVVLRICRQINQDGGIYISKYPIDSLDLSSELIMLPTSDKNYRITKNECFYITEDHSKHSLILEHKILTECGFETSTIIEPPATLHRYDCIEVEICGSALYVMHGLYVKLSIFKYKISRNADGKLSFTLEEQKVLDRNDSETDGGLYKKIKAFFWNVVCSNNLYLADSAFTTEKFHSWIDRVSHGEMDVHAVHANYVFCSQWTYLSGISIFPKDNLIKCLEANGDLVDLKGATIYGIEPVEKPSIYWISVIYIGLKAKILVQYAKSLCLIDFY